jgi:hypothetical protein
MKMEDGGAAITYDQLTLDEFDLLISHDGVDQVLVGDDEITIIFKDDGFSDVTGLPDRFHTSKVAPSLT